MLLPCGLPTTLVTEENAKFQLEVNKNKGEDFSAQGQWAF